MKTLIVTFVLTFAFILNGEAQKKRPNTGVADPVMKAQWSKRSDSLVIKWIDKNVKEDGMYRISNNSGTFSKDYYVEVIDNQQDVDRFLIKYSDGQFASWNRNYMKLKIGHRIFFTLEEYNSWETNDFYSETTGTQVECGNSGIVIRINEQQEIEEIAGVRLLDTPREDEIHIDEIPFGERETSQRVLTRDEICMSLEAQWTDIQNDYDQKRINRQEAKRRFNNLMEYDQLGCTAEFTTHYRNDGVKVAVVGGVAVAAYLIGRASNNGGHSSGNGGIKIPHTEPTEDPFMVGHMNPTQSRTNTFLGTVSVPTRSLGTFIPGDGQSGYNQFQATVNQ